MDLGGVLAPLSSEEFFGSYWGRQCGHFPGRPGKFAALLPWDRLNEILRQYRLDSTRLRLVKQGKLLPVDSYLEYDVSTRDPFQRVACLKVDGMTEQLQKGATLVLDAVDELHDPLTRLVEAFERELHINVQVNAYATWRQDRGFEVHWDDHDVMILQVAGRKRWTVFGPSRRYPLGKDVEPNPAPPADSVWEDLLSDGDALYIPRGWWHVALPLEEPSLHLTVNFVNPTGFDFLGWLAGKARSREIVRRDLPRFADRAEREAHAKQLREEFLLIWEENSIDSYLDFLDSELVLRPHPSLPWSGSADGLPDDDGARVLLALPALNISRDPELRLLRLRCEGRDWVLFEDAEPLLEALGDAQPHTIRDLCESLEGRIASERVRELLKELVVHGLLEILPDPTG